MRKLYLSFLVLLGPFFGMSQVNWNFTTAAPTSVAPATISASAVSSGNTTATLISTTSASSGYTGASGGGNAGAIPVAGAFNAATSAYFEFTLTPGPGLSASISQINFGARSTATGPINYDIRSSLDNFAAAALTGTALANSAWALHTNTVSLTGAADQAITVRIYGYNGTGTSSSVNWRIDDLTVTAATGGSAPSTPTVSGSPASLSGFTATAGAASNPTQTETVGGTNLTDNITVTAAGGYEVSLDNSVFLSAVTLTQSGGTVAPTPVFVRIVSTSTIGAVSGSLSIVSTGATTQTVTLTGAVSSNLAPPQNLTATAVSSSEIDLTGTGDAGGDNILMAFTTGAGTFGTPAGALAVGAVITGGGTVLYNGPSAGFSFSHTGLNPGTKYNYSAWTVDGSNNYSPTAATANATTGNPPAAKVVVNQVYGGGGNSDAIYMNDFIELFNDADTVVPLQGWSVQYSSATGTSWQVTPLTGTIPAHGFYLVQESQGTGGTTPLPAPDATGTIAMAAASGKVLLCNTITAQTGKIPTGANVIDAVAYGTADILEGTGTAPLLSNTTADVRKVDGVSTGDNAADFMLTAPLPRNSIYIITPPVVTTFSPINGFVGLNAGFHPSLVFTKPIVRSSGSITLLTNGTGAPIDNSNIAINGDTVNFNMPLAPGNSYAIEIAADALQDAYGNDFAGLTTPASWAFTTYNSAVAVPLDTALNYDFNTCVGSGLLPNGFTQFSETGAQIWDCTAFGRDPNAPQGTAAFPSGVEINGFANGINNTNKDWLISPRLDLTGTTVPLLSYWSRNAFAGDPLQLMISTDYTGTGDPNLATWTVLNGKFPSVGSDTWTQSININLSGFKQAGVFIAFLYTSTTDDGSRWSLDDIRFFNSPVNPPPSLTLSTANIEFGFASAGNTVTKKLIVTGNDLTSDVTLSSEGSFLLSTDSTHFSTSVTLGKDTSNNVAEPVFVRFAPSINNTEFVDSMQVAIDDSMAIVNVKGNSIDPASTLSVVDWNLNWFGTPDPTLGVADKSLQETNVAIILPSLKADLYVLQEVVNEHALDSIVGTMPGYAVVVGQYGSFSNPTLSDADPLNTIQKLAFVYNTAKIANIQTDSLLTLGVNTPQDPTTVAYNDWASGRFPYMLTADVTLADPNGGSNTKTVHFINIHAKSNLSPVITSYNRRWDGARKLDSLILHDFPNSNDNVMVLGDFNDDLNQTITAGISGDTSSYISFTVHDSSFYKFPTKTLSQQGQHSDVNFTTGVIDNVIINNQMASFYLPSSATVLSDVAGLVSKYGTTTTDHYPVFSQFSFTPPVVLPVTLLSFTGVRQEATVKLSWVTSEENNSKEFDVERSGDGSHFTAIGVVAARGNSASTTNYTFSDAQPLTGDNYYRLRQVDIDGKSVYSKTLKLNFSGAIALRISPNPAHGTANIYTGNTTEALSIRILDLNGRIVRDILTTPGTANIPVDLTGMARGVYMVKVISSSSLATEKLLVQ